MKILLVTQDPENNISFYRGSGPLKRLAEKYPDINYDIARPEFHVELLKEYDIVLITCPYTTKHVELIKAAVKYDVKVWVDFDDLLTDIPVWNERAFLEYKQHPVASVVQFSLIWATFVTVSTAFLKSELDEIAESLHLKDNIYIVENAFDHEFLTNPAPIGTSKEVLYRGGQSHNADLWEYHKPILNAMRKTDWKPHFVGMNPIYINQELNGTWTPQLSKPNYWNFLENNTAKILIVPLKDRPFNRAKSCIAWIEGTYAGCSVLAPNWEEWQKPGVMNYDNQVDFEGKLKGMMQGRIKLEGRVEKSREYIMNCQTLLKVNETRFALLEKYCK